MITCIIIMAISLALIVLLVWSSIDVTDAAELATIPAFVFVVTLIVTIMCSTCAKENKSLYNDMAKNPQCYSINDLKEAHKSIQYHKAHQGHLTSFYNGYEFPEIDVNVMNEVDNTIHIVK